MSSAHREVSQKEIYDSYLGIVRLSPNINPSNPFDEYIDEPTSFLTDVDASKHNTDGLQLSDSSGIGLPHFFVPRVFRTNVLNNSGLFKEADVILQTNYIPKLYATNKLKIKSNLFLDGGYKKENGVNKKEELTKTPIGFLFTEDEGTSFSLLNYPINSPYYSQYFNDKGKLAKLTNASDRIVIDAHGYDGERINQMNEELVKKSPEWFRNTSIINPSQIVVANGKNVFYSNEEGKAIPALYTHDFMLGAYDTHTITPTSLPEGIDNLSIHVSKETKLSWFDVDKMIWDIVDDCLRGTLRHTASRYSGFIGNKDGLDRIFGNVSTSKNSKVDINPSFSVSSCEYEDNFLKGSSMILGQEVQIGTFISHAVPLRRLLFLQEKQKMYNASCASLDKASEKEGSDTDLNAIKKHVNAQKNKGNDGNMKPMERMVNSVANSLSKNFLICDGREINVRNYPYMNIFNYNLFGNWSLDSAQTFPSVNAGKLTGIYSHLKAATGGIFMTPAIYSSDDRYNPTFIRGAQWDLNYTDLLRSGRVNKKMTDIPLDAYGENYERYNTIGNYPTTSNNVCINYFDGMQSSLKSDYVLETAQWELSDISSDNIAQFVRLHRFNRFIPTTSSFVSSLETNGKYFVYNGGTIDRMGNTFEHYHMIFSSESSKTSSAPTFELAKYQDSSTRAGLKNNPFSCRDIYSYSECVKRNGVKGDEIQNSNDWWRYNSGLTSELHGNKPIRTFWGMYRLDEKYLKYRPISGDESGTNQFLRNEEDEASMVASAVGGYGPPKNKHGLYVTSACGQCHKFHRHMNRGHYYARGGTSYYKISQNNSYEIGIETGKYTRCLTSLPYKNGSSLGLKNSKDVRNSYANQIFDEKAQKIQSPIPPSIFLTPLIRI